MVEQTIINPETGETLYRDVRPIEYTYKGESMTVDQPGWYPLDKNNVDDGILSQEDAKATDFVLKILKSRVKARENNLQFNQTAFA